MAGESFVDRLSFVLRARVCPEILVLADLIPQFLAAAVCGVLAARDPIWVPRGLGFRIGVVWVWAISPLGVVAAGSFVEGELTIESWYPYVAVMAAVLLITRGRPALLMDQIWPEEARQDSELVTRSEKCGLWFIATVIGGLVIWITFELT